MKIPFFSSLRARLFGLALFVVLPALGLITYTSFEQRNEEASKAKEEALRLAGLVGVNQGQLIEATRHILVTLAKISEVKRQDPHACREFISDLLVEYPLYTNFGVAMLNGDIFCSALPMSGLVNIADRLYFRDAVRTKSFATGEYQIGRITKKPAVNFGYPVKNPHGEVEAVVYAAMDLKWFEVIASEMKLPPGAVVTLMDYKGVVLARIPDPEGWAGRSAAETPIGKVVFTNKAGTVQEVGLDGKKRLYGFTALRDGPENGRVFVWVGIPEEVAFADVKRTFTRNLLVLGLMTLLILAAAWVGADVFVLRGVNALIKATDTLAGGELSARTSLPSDKSELGQLGRSFNKMADSLEKHYTEMQTLQDIDRSMLSTLDLPTVLDLLLEKIDCHLPYSASTVKLYDKAAGRLMPVAQRNINPWQPQSNGGTPQRALPDLVFDHKAPTAVKNIERDAKTNDRETLLAQGFRSYLGIPLQSKKDLLGVLSFYTKEEHHFTSREIEFLTTLAGQAAIAINNSQLYEDMKCLSDQLTMTNKDLEKQEQIQTLLKELSQDITELDIDSLLKRLTETVRAIIHVDICDVWLLENGASQIVGISGIEKERIRSERTGAGQGRSRWIVDNRKPLVVTDMTESTGLQTGSTLRKLGVRGYAGIPLFSRAGQVIGILRALSFSPRRLTEEEMDLLNQLAAGAAIALQNAKLLEQTQKQAKELAESNMKLEKASRVKSEFLSVISHELRTPLNVILGYTGIVTDGTFGNINPEQQEALKKVISQSKDMLSMITGILQVTQIEAHEVRLNYLDENLNDMVKSLKSAYDIPLKKSVSVCWDHPFNLPTVWTDGEKVRYILQNLIDNAIKFTDEGPIMIMIRYLPSEKAIQLKVADAGVGIPKEQIPVIYEMFRQGDSSETRPYGGVGLGLFIVKKYTELLGGRIEVESAVGRGSTFTVTIPCESNRIPNTREADS